MLAMSAARPRITFRSIKRPNAKAVGQAVPTNSRWGDVYSVPQELGIADGMAINEQDRLWVAFFGGWCVLCIDPVEGEVVSKIELSVANVTACSFGGKDMDELHITTAKLGLDEKQTSTQPLAGDLFVARPGVCRPNWPSFPG